MKVALRLVNRMGVGAKGITLIIVFSATYYLE